MLFLAASALSIIVITKIYCACMFKLRESSPPERRSKTLSSMVYKGLLCEYGVIAYLRRGWARPALLGIQKRDARGLLVAGLLWQRRELDLWIAVSKEVATPLLLKENHRLA